MWMFGVTRVRDTSHFRNGLCRSSGGGAHPWRVFAKGGRQTRTRRRPLHFHNKALNNSHPTLCKVQRGGTPFCLWGILARCNRKGGPPARFSYDPTTHRVVASSVPARVCGCWTFLAGAPSPAVSSPHVSVVPGISVMVGFWVTVCDAELCRRRTECPIYSQASLPGVFTSTPGRVAR